jgi:hypothetical protein
LANQLASTLLSIQIKTAKREASRSLYRLLLGLEWMITLPTSPALARTIVATKSSQSALSALLLCEEGASNLIKTSEKLPPVVKTWRAQNKKTPKI